MRWTFQSTRPRGARRNMLLTLLKMFVFQSTRPRGARRGADIRAISCASFNPRAREGRDMMEDVIVQGNFSFNPRAREGRDEPTTASLPTFAVSIHAPARGATFLWWYSRNPAMEFQSTRPRGARLGETFPL